MTRSTPTENEMGRDGFNRRTLNRVDMSSSAANKYLAAAYSAWKSTRTGSLTFNKEPNVSSVAS
jgi:hypothetical protein